MSSHVCLALSNGKTARKIAPAVDSLNVLDPQMDIIAEAIEVRLGPTGDMAATRI